MSWTLKNDFHFYISLNNDSAADSFCENKNVYTSMSFEIIIKEDIGSDLQCPFMNGIKQNKHSELKWHFSRLVTSSNLKSLLWSS